MFVHETFTIDRIIHYPTLNNTVAAVQYSYTIDNLVNQEFKFSKVVLLPLPTENFVQFENLSEEMVKQWILQNDASFDDTRRQYLSELYDTEYHTTYVTQLPWNN